MFGFGRKKEPDNEALLRKANVLYVKKKYTSALKIYARILKVDSKNFAALANTATAYFELQKFDLSIPFFKKTIKMDSSNPWWHNYLSQSFQKCGNFSAALESAWQAVLLSENDNAHHINFAYALYEVYDETGREKTDSYVKKWYEKYPQNPIAEQCYKSYFYDKNFSRANRKYVEELFDVFAPDFDNVLSELEYDSPKIIAEYLSQYFLQNKDKNISILDLGCGSGLCGKYIKKKLKKSHLMGVDVSSKMLEKAKEKNVYSELVKCDIMDCFCNKKMGFDVLVASDVLTYFGQLDSLFVKAASLLCKNGIFVFSISENKINNFDFFLTPSSRFVHSENYIDSLIKKHKFIVMKSDKKVLRKEGEKNVEGMIYLIKKM